MQVGLLYDVRNPAPWARPWKEHYGRALELCEEADRLGAGGVWFTEHHLFDDGYLPQPLTLAAAVAARTRSVRIGTAVLLGSLRIPAQLAEEAAIVDLLSEGRLELGIGAGYRAPEFELFGIPYGRRLARTEAVIREVLRLWDGVVTPAPLQEPVPLWGGFFGPLGARLAGRLGIGLLHVSRTHLADYLAGLDEGGHDRATARMSGVFLDVFLADDPDAVWPRIGPHLAYWHDTYARAWVEGTDAPVPPPVDPETLRHKVKTPAEAGAYIRERADGLPVEHVITMGDLAGLPDDLVQRNLELACTELAPLLR